MFNVVLLVYGVGFLASVVLPYIQSWLDDPSIVFDWRYVISRLLGSVMPLLLAVVDPGTVALIENAINTYEGNYVILYIFVFVAGYGSSQLGQQARKTINTFRQ